MPRLTRRPGIHAKVRSRQLDSGAAVLQVPLLIGLIGELLAVCAPENAVLADDPIPDTHQICVRRLQKDSEALHDQGSASGDRRLRNHDELGVDHGRDVDRLVALGNCGLRQAEDGRREGEEHGGRGNHFHSRLTDGLGESTESPF